MRDSRGRLRRTLHDRLDTAEPVMLVVAGPNGAGKSTFIDTFVRPTGLLVVNADEIAKALSAQDVRAIAYEAAQAAEARRRDLVSRRSSFCMETVFSDPDGAKVAFLNRCQAAGYAVLLVFIGIDTADLSRARVLQRVAVGGHDVPDDKLASRFPRTFANLRAALTFVNHVWLLDNSSADAPYRFVAEYQNGKRLPRSGYRAAWSDGLERQDGHGHHDS